MTTRFENDLERTPSKKRGSNSGLVGTTSGHSHSSLEVEGDTPYSTFQSAYTAPPYPRPQADRDHQQESLIMDRERGDLTAHNLELIPNADQVAPGIRLDRGGNDFLYHDRPLEERASNANDDAEDQILPDVVGETEVEGDNPLRDTGDKRSTLSGKTPSSIDATGRSSNGVADLEDGADGADSDSHEMFEDVDEGDDDVFDEKLVNVVHERVGGSGATSENASKGTSVGHFGPRGEAIRRPSSAGVPPHLDPRQPHFRPPSPSAQSVLSVAVHPPASPKLHGMGGPGSSGAGGLASSSSIENPDVSDSGEETERFESGALTPTLSEENDDDQDDVGLDKAQSAFDASSPTPSPSLAADGVDPFGFGRLNLGSGPQVSFDPNVLSYQSDSLGGSMLRTARAPSIAATAGSSRAPSTRGLSPPVSFSRATTEGSSMGEFDSTGTGIGESGVQTPSIVRSRRSSYSAPSSELEQPGGSIGIEAGDLGTRARGATLVAQASAIAGSSTSLVDEPEDILGDGPSLAPSEAGSDSTRSMTQDSSSLDHGIYPNLSSGGIAVGGHGSSDRLLPSSNPAFAGTSSSGMFEPPSPGDFAGLKGSLHPTLPSLLAIKKASRRNGSGAASTAATAGTASPTSSLSVDGDYEEAAAAVHPQTVE